MRRGLIFLTAALAVLCFLTPVLAVEGASGASVSGVAWLDSAADGVRGARESALNRVSVTLERVVGATVETVATATTGRDGAYAFTGLPAGEYCLSISLPSGHQFTLHGADSAALPASGRDGITPNFTLAQNEALSLGIGATKQSGRLAMSAFEDENANGGRRDNEARVRGVTVNLMYDYNGKSYIVATEETDKSGECVFDDLSPATYYVSAVLPDNFLPGPLGEKISIYYNCLLPSKTNIAVSAPFDMPVKGSVGLSMGMVRTGAARGRVWFDDDGDGALSAADGGADGATVTLESPDMGLSYDIALNADGSFSVNHVMPGEYRLSVTLPQGAVFADAASSITAESRAGDVPVTIRTDGDTVIPDVGVVSAASVSVFVYDDRDVNGMNSDGDPAYAGAAVAAYRDGALIRSAVTDERGEALLTDLRGGAFEIVCALKDGDVFTVSGDGNDFYAPSALSQSSAYADVPRGGTVYLNAGATRAAAIAGEVYMSADNSGVFVPGAEMLAGFTVQAINERGEIAAQTTTDASGAFTLAVPPSRHMVRVLFIDPYIAAPQNGADNMIEYQTQESGDTPYLSLTPGGTVSGVRAALFAAGEVDGYVIMDEPGVTTGLAGVAVTLLDEYGAPVSDFACDTTDENGYFYIKGVLPGAYSVAYAVPHDIAFTEPLTDQTEIESEPFSIEAKARVRLSDVFAVRTGSISGHLYHLLDDGYEPMSGEVIVTDASGEFTYETRVMDDGEYALSGLRPGEYVLTVALPEGYLFNAAPGAFVPVTRDSTASVPFTIGLDENVADADAYGSLPASAAGTLYFDCDNSGGMGEADAVIPARTLAFSRGGERYEATTDDAGAFMLDMLPPGEYLMEIDLDEDCILIDQNALQKDGRWTLPVTLGDGESLSGLEIGALRYAEIAGQVWNMDGTEDDVSGLTIELKTADGAAVQSAVTDENGRFAFDKLYPGEYALDAALPEGCLFAREVDAVSRASYILGDITGGGESQPFALDMGEKRRDCDIGIGAIGGIGDLAWLDENGNGMQDLGERVMPGIEITLFRYGEEAAKTVTDAYGRYEIDGLYPGAYVMQVVMHKELKATARQTEFPLVGSILPEESGTTVTVENVIVTSGRINRACDLGFALRKKNAYPDAMQETPDVDWRPYSDRPVTESGPEPEG